MNDKEKCLVDISTLNGVSNWLTILPVTEFEFQSKQQFLDSVRLLYGWENMQSINILPCGSKFDIQQSMSCKKGDFICLRHNDLRNLAANMMSKVCNDSEIKPKLTLLSVEELQDATSNNSNKARVDIRTRGFSEKGQRVFFDLWVFDTNACCYRNNSLQQCYVMNEQETFK